MCTTTSQKQVCTNSTLQRVHGEEQEWSDSSQREPKQTREDNVKLVLSRQWTMASLKIIVEAHLIFSN